MTGINNQGDDGTDNRLVVDYSVIFSNVLNNVVASSNYYISSGVVISDYYNEVGRPQSLKPSLELTLKLVATHHHHPPPISLI